MCVALLGNTGYLGLPFNAALFGFDQIGTAVVYDVLVSTMRSSPSGSRSAPASARWPPRARDRVRVFFTRNPPIWAAVAGLLAPAALAPDWAVDASRVLVFAILPIGFFVVGVTLSREAEEGAAKFPPPLNAPVLAGIALKLGVMPGVLLGAGRADPRRARHLLRCRRRCAAAINTILIADEYGLDRGLTAAAIAWTTTIVVVVGLVVALL